MAIDVSKFHTTNVLDTCSIWNILSSTLLYSTAITAKCIFSCTDYVLYECVYKPRKNPSYDEISLKNRFIAEISRGKLKSFSLSVEDLQGIEILQKRKNLSKGELSSIVFALKTMQAFLTDDQKARKLAGTVMINTPVQTTPHLFGWLFFTGLLVDSDKDVIIHEHTRYNRPLAPYFEDLYAEALRCRSMQSQI